MQLISLSPYFPNDNLQFESKNQLLYHIKNLESGDGGEILRNRERGRGLNLVNISQKRSLFILNLPTNNIKLQIKPASLVMKKGVGNLDVDKYSKSK